MPSQPVELVANPDTWLDFTDLVFIDPVGTGFSRLIDPDDALRDRYLSIDGDVEALADFILRWLTENGRTRRRRSTSSARATAASAGRWSPRRCRPSSASGSTGMMLLSPVLDFGWWQQPDYAPLPKVALLPSLAAAAMEESGAVLARRRSRRPRTTPPATYVTDLLRGVEDEAAVARLVERVSALTGLDRAAVERAAGRGSTPTPSRARRCATTAGGSAPTTPTVASADPTPGRRAARPPTRCSTR